MKNIISFELKRLYGRLTTYIFLALIFLGEGIFITYCNLYNGIPGIEYTAEFITLPLMLSMPILTFQLFSWDRASGHDSVLEALGISAGRQIISKYLAGLSVFAVSSVPLIIAPFLFSAFSDVNYPAAFVGILGYLLFGNAIYCVCMLVSAVTPRPLFSVIFSYVAVVLIYICELLRSLFYLDLNVSFVSLTVIILLLSLAFMRLTRSDYGWLALLAVLEGAALAVRMLSPETLSRIGMAALDFIGIRGNMAGFCYGLFDITSVITLLVFSALMLLLCGFPLRLKMYGAVR